LTIPTPRYLSAQSAINPLLGLDGLHCIKSCFAKGSPFQIFNIKGW